jgi:hypothetical protein
LRRHYCQTFGPNCYLAKLANGLCRYFDVRLHFDKHLIWQATKRKLERSDAFGFLTWVTSGGFAASVNVRY